jgi:hypothetical protein
MDEEKGAVAVAEKTRPVAEITVVKGRNFLSELKIAEKKVENQ